MKFKFKAIKLQNYLSTPFPTPKTNQHAVITQFWIKFQKMLVSRRTKNGERLVNGVFSKTASTSIDTTSLLWVQLARCTRHDQTACHPLKSQFCCFSARKRKSSFSILFAVFECVRLAGGWSQHKYFCASLPIHPRSRHLFFFFLLEQI